MLTTLRNRAIETPRWMLLLLLGSMGLILVLVIPTLYRSLTTPSQGQILQHWAEATQKGDLATAQGYMQVNPLVQELWLEQTRMFQQQGRMGMVHVIHQRQAGQSLMATLYWHTSTMEQGQQTRQGMPGMNDPKAPAGDATGGEARSTDPLCLQVQVGPDGKVVPVTAYHACAPQEMP
jgi:hypothetical protein